MPRIALRIVPHMDLHDPMKALDPAEAEEPDRAEAARRVEIDDLKRVMSTIGEPGCHDTMR